MANQKTVAAEIGKVCVIEDTRPGPKAAYAYWLSVTAALAGVLFGFDTAVINGAVVFLRQEFGLSEVGTGAAVSSLLLGCVIGAAAGGTLSDRWGRKKVLLVSSVLFALSTIGAAIPSSFRG